MKFTSVFTAVLALHLVVIAVLLVQPGCSSSEKQRAERPSSVLGESREGYAETGPADHGSGIHSDFNSGITTAAVQKDRPALQPPSRPSWTLFEESEPVAQRAPTATRTEVLQPVRPQTPAMATYTVQGGDSLWKISRDRGVSLEALLAANNLTRDSVLRVGQQLKIPGEGASLPVASTEEQGLRQESTVDTATTTHTVRSGDTLSGLARQYGTTVPAIQAANSLRDSTIRLGQNLVIPASGSVAQAAPSPAPRASAAPAASAKSYTVRSGDTLDAISRQFGVPVADLMRDNSIADARRLRVGQELRIRGAAAPQQERTTAPATPQVPPRTTPVPPVPQPSAQAPEFNEVEVETITLDPLDMLDDVPVIEAEESN